MPPVIFALAAAAGFFAASRVIASMMGTATPDAMTAADPPAQTAAETARNLGHLEWDPASGVYRPKV
ncbi:MAG: hypothetical protein B7Y80_12030 [Hyphomicrobium sp. 32-62-53]|nr:MAG: hypothetical protein B7Z29_00880 [Hyphomicrobium sp. 12-62-95]OYX99233.1 MAG: hypothetical protein B7Y80_12030 [Hyphomicrobium sp. 32-62-53]